MSPTTRRSALLGTSSTSLPAAYTQIARPVIRFTLGFIAWCSYRSSATSRRSSYQSLWRPCEEYEQNDNHETKLPTTRKTNKPKDKPHTNMSAQQAKLGSLKNVERISFPCIHSCQLASPEESGEIRQKQNMRSPPPGVDTIHCPRRTAEKDLMVMYSFVEYLLPRIAFLLPRPRQ